MSAASRTGTLLVCALLLLAGVTTPAAEEPAGPSPAVAAPAEGTRWLIVEAEDPQLCQAAGEATLVHFPPQDVMVLRPEASLTVSFDARAIYLRLPLEFTAPGPGYGLNCDPGAKLRCSVDDRVVAEVFPFRLPREFPLVEDLAAGRHTLRVEAVGATCAVDGFRLAQGPLSRIQGLITADVYSELLVDVRAEVFGETGLVRTEYVRTPHDGGSFQIVGLVPGVYRLLLTAAGWEPLSVPAVTVEREGMVVDVGVLVLRRSQWARAQSWYGDAAPRFGRTINVAPGGSFRTRLFLSGRTVPGARLRSQFRTVTLKVDDVVAEDFGRWNGVGLATFTVPADAPMDMYALEVGGRLLPQAVCVREPLPDRFFLAGVSHVHVWGQRASERMVRLAEMAQLAGARAFLMANEVNPAYIVGALMNLRIPYAVCRGNHMMGRWSDFFGWGCTACDDGPLRLVTFGGFPYESWAEPRELLQARPEATCRVILCYEGFAPISLIRDEAVDVLFDGHTDDPHPDSAQFPEGTLHFRAPGGLKVRWIPMTHAGLDPSVRTAADIPLVEIPWNGLAPLRVEFTQANDGTAEGNTARITNETTVRFPGARLRLVMEAGRYEVTGGQVLQAFDSDDGALRVIDVQVEVPPRSETVVVCRRAAGP